MKRKLLFAALCVVSVLGLRAQTDVTSTYIVNPGFESCTARTSNLAAGGSAAGDNYADAGWTLAQSSAWCSSAVIAYGGSGQVNGASAPSTDNAGNAGNTLGISVGWNNTNKYQSTNAITLPAGHYVLKVYAYNNLSGKTSFTSLLGFVPTSGSSYLSTKTSFAYGEWVIDQVEFDLAEATEGKFQIGGKAGNNKSSEHAIVFFDNLTLTWTDPDLAAAQVQLGGYIKKATALNNVLSDATLSAAITSAQGVLNDAITSSDCNTASTELNSAISTAMSGTTTVSLTNGNFDTEVNIAANGTSSATFISPATKEKPYIYAVNGWTPIFTFDHTAAQGTTAAYGATITGDKGNNGTNPPAKDIIGSTEGGVLHLSSGWGDQARYKQEISDLPSGRYIFYYEANNQNGSANSINSNYFGVSGTDGDFYGTTNGFVYSTAKTFAYDTWTANAFEFDVAKTANITFNIGLIGTTGGSATGAKLWIDNVSVYRIADLIVTEEDANAIIAQAEALESVKFNATDKTNLASKLSAFKADKNIDNYNDLNAAIIQANASKDVYTALNTAITNVEGWTSYSTTVTDPIRTKYNDGSYSNSTTAADIYSEYQSAEIAALAADDAAADWTSVILDPSFETGGMTLWSAESRNDTGVKDQSNGTYSINSGDAVDGLKLFNSWGGTAENNVYQTIKNLPAGTYTLTALVAGFKDETLTVSANETSNSVVVADDKTVGYTVSVKFTLGEAGDVVIKASNTKSQDGSDASFIKADNFKLFKGDVMTDDYTALNAAITAAEDYTLGFETGEYAPYENVGALQALATAKAVNQTVKTAQPVLDEIVANLNGATWTANPAEVNAIYDGTFAIQPEHTTGPTALLGWNNPVGIRQLIKNTDTYTGLNSATDKAAVFAWGNTTMTYGETEGYTLPLNAYTLYELSFKTCGWQDGEMGYVNVDIKNSSNEGLQTVATKTATKRITESEPWDEFKILFVTGEAGNYKLGMWTSKHTTFTDIVLKKAASQTLTFAEDGSTPKFAAGTYPTISLDRTFSTANYSTLVLPFAMDATETADAFAEAYTLSGVEGESLKFTAATKIAAGTPCLVKAKAATLSVANKAIDPTTTVTNTVVSDASSTVTFVGTFAGENLTSANSNAWVVSNDKLYKVDSNVTVGAYRGYFTVASTTPVKALNLDLEGTDGIETLRNAENETMGNAIFNLAGQRINKLQKGVNIINGKKVLVK